MGGVVVDSSTLLLAAAPAGDPRGDDALAALAWLSDEAELFAPARVAYEVAHVVHAKFPDRFGRTLAERAEVARQLLSGIELDSPDADRVERIGAFAEAHGLTGSDASVLECAARRNALLVTDDTGLLAAARAALGADRAVRSSDLARRRG